MMMLWLLASLAAIALGMLAAFAAGMAASPTQESERISRNGCVAFVAGLVSLITCLATWVLP